MVDRRSGLETAGVDGVSGGVNMLAPWLVYTVCDMSSRTIRCEMGRGVEAEGKCLANEDGELAILWPARRVSRVGGD